MTTATTVTVACKIPNGLILRVWNMVERKVALRNGASETVTEWHPTGESVTIAGPGRAKGEDARAPVSGGYALTHNVDADFFQRWMADNKDHPAVVNHLLFAHEKPESATRVAAERFAVKSGLEPIVPDKDPRVPRQARTADKK